MNGLVESFKKVFENKKAHIFLLIISFLWALLSTSFDLLIGKSDSYTSNFIDFIFSLYIGTYSLVFLHNAINNINNGILPSFTDIKIKYVLGNVLINIVWGIYALIAIVLSVLFYMLATHSFPLFIFFLLIIGFVGLFAYYIFLAYAEEFKLKGLFNITLIFKLIKHTIKPTLKKLGLFILLSLVIICVYIVICAIVLLFEKYIPVTEWMTFISDVILATIAVYVLVVIWYLAFPHNLIDTYKTLGKIAMKGNKNND